jgi:hypothetical protein
VVATAGITVVVRIAGPPVCYWPNASGVVNANV